MPSFSQPGANLKTLDDAWAGQIQAGDTMASDGKQEAAFEQFSKSLETARTIRRWYGGTSESRRRLLVSLVMNGAVAVDLGAKTWAEPI